MRAEGPTGAEIILEHSEVLDEQGNFLNNIMGRHKDQKDTTDMRYTGSFECSDERLNRLQLNIVWSELSNMLSIPMDCPQRERAGWTGDIQVFAPTAAFNMDVLTFLTRWLRNLALEQLPNGEVPNGAPYHKSFRHIDHTLMGKDSSAGWDDAIIIVPWALYQAYGDVQVLEEFYDSMVGWIDYVRRTAENEMPDSFEQMDDVQKERQKYLWNTVDVIIPPNTTGTVDLPNAKHENVKESGMPLKETLGIIWYRQIDLGVSLLLGSGNYRFTV